MTHLGKALRMLTSTAVRYLPGKHKDMDGPVENLPPEGTQRYRPGDGIAAIRDVSADGEGIGRNALLGFFRDDNRADYLMVVNLRQAADRTAEQAAGSVTLTFDRAVRAVWRLSRKTGRPEKVPVTDGKLHLTLPGGTGDLLKIADDTFPAL